MPSSPILQPVTIGDLTLKNRVRMAPLTRSRSNAEGVTQESREVPDGVDFLDLRRRFEGAFIGNNDLTLDLAEKELAEGGADLFSFGRPYLANPDLVGRFASGTPLAEAPKIYWYGGGADGYSD